MNAKPVDVCIIGSGMTGLATAIQLADLGFSVVICDQAPFEKSQLDAQISVWLDNIPDSRVSALTLASVQLLKSLNAWDSIAAWRLAPYEKMQVWDGETRGEVTFDAYELHQPQMGYIVENRAIVYALIKVALKHHNIRFEWNTRVQAISSFTEQGRTLNLSSGVNLQALLVIGADGALSQTRKQLGFTTHEWDYGQHAVVATLTLAGSHQNTCWQRFTEDGPLALLPLASPENNLVSLVWSTSPLQAKACINDDETSLCAKLSFAMRHTPARIVAAQGVQTIPLRQRHATDYVKQGCALVGDAAHTIHPLAGQGVNLGLLDSAALADTLAEGRSQKMKISDLTLLRRYERERQLDNLRMAGVMEGFKRLFDTQSAPIEWLRSLGMRHFNQCLPIKHHLMTQAMGLGDGLPSRMHVK